MEKRLVLSVKGQEISYWQKIWVLLLFFFSEKGGVEKDAGNADAKLV